jgi:hypothetical protein
MVSERRRCIEGEKMKRTANALMLLAALGGGCMSTAKNDPNAQAHYGVAGTTKAVPNAVGPWGDPVPARYGEKPPVVRTTKKKDAEVVQADAKSKNNYNGIQQVVGFGPRYDAVPGGTPVPGAVAATGALVNTGMNQFGNGRTSIRFAGPAGMKVAWYTGQPGAGGFGPTMVEAPGRYNFPQGAAYRLKLSDFPNRPGLELYPSLEVIPANIKTATFLAHSAVPVYITEEDLEQVLSGNFVIKVVYLPDPAYQDLAAAGPDEVVSSRLEPGVDPVAEAQRRGSVLLILRIGNIDLEAPNTPSMDSPPGGGINSGRPTPGPMPGAPLRNPPIPITPPGTTIPGGPIKPASAKVTASASTGWFRMK